MSTFNGWTVVAIPTTPVFPASFEFQDNALVAANENPFTGQQQIQNWGTGYMTASVSYAPMTATTAAPWKTFLNSLNGMACVFQFQSAVMTAYPELNGTQGNGYWRLKTNYPKWEVKEGSIYSFTFEIREAT
jgi:hypothetical protein